MGLLTVLWLNMAVLPCAMAFESDTSCAHCPPADEHDITSHHSHSEVQVDPTCATLRSQCCDLEQASVDARGGKIDIKPPSEVVFITAPVIATVPNRTSGRVRRASDPPDIYGSSPPLRILYCVYLK